MFLRGDYAKSVHSLPDLKLIDFCRASTLEVQKRDYTYSVCLFACLVVVVVLFFFGGGRVYVTQTLLAKSGKLLSL